jgi:ribosome-binding factor A
VAGRQQRHGGGRQSGSRRAGGEVHARRYPRVARINEVLRQVLAEEIERQAVSDERLTLLTVTGVEADPDYRRARVLFAELSDEATAGLAACRPRLQAAVARQVRLKWTPTLAFETDPAVVEGRRVEEILRTLGASPATAADPPPAGSTTTDSPPPVPGTPGSDGPAGRDDGEAEPPL